MANRKLVVEQATGAAALSLFIGISVFLAPLKPNIVELQLTFSQAAFQHVIDLWQAAGVRLFRSHFVADFALLICYGVNGYLFASRTRLFQHYSLLARNVVILAMPLAAICDAAENCLHLYFTAPNANPASSLYPIAGTSAAIKLVLILIYLITIPWAAVRNRKKCAND